MGVIAELFHWWTTDRAEAAGTWFAAVVGLAALLAALRQVKGLRQDLRQDVMVVLKQLGDDEKNLYAAWVEKTTGTPQKRYPR